MFISMPRPRVPVPYPSGLDSDPYVFAANLIPSDFQNVNELAWQYLQAQHLHSMAPGESSGSRRSKPKPKKQASKDKSQHLQRRQGASAAASAAAAGSSSSHDSNPNPSSLGLVDSSFLPTALSHPEQTNNFVVSAIAA